MATRVTVDEETLVARYRAGDGSAFASLFGRHEADLMAFVERRLPRALRRRVAVSDVVQQTRIVAFDRHGDFVPEGRNAFRRWVFGIAAKSLLGSVRHHRSAEKRSVGREAPTGVGPAAEAVPARIPTPSHVAASEESRELVNRAIEALSADHARVLRLVHLEGLTLAEAAARMARTREAVKKLYGRALRALGAEIRGTVRPA